MISKPNVSPPIPVSEPGPVRVTHSPERPNGHSPPPLGGGSSATETAVKRRAGWGWLITLLVLGGLSFGAWQYRTKWLPTVTGWFTRGGPPAKPPVRPIPVVTAAARERDMDLYLNGLGTVTSLKTVTVRSRVEGEIINVDFQEGQMVYKDRLLAEIDTRPFILQRDQANGMLERDQATLELAKLNMKRLEALQQKLPSSVTQQQIDEQDAIAKQTEGMIKSDLAQVATAELQLKYCKIVAPITGRIGLRLVDVGNIVRANEPNGLAVITQLEPIALVFTIPQDDIPRVQKRMSEGHELSVDAYDRDFKTKLATGKLIAIDNQVDPMTGTLRMKAQFDKNDNVLFPNQFVNTRLLVDTLKKAIVVPSAAVQRGPNFTFVYLVKSDETVELREVVIGPTEGAETAIESGLKPGEVVVTEGIDKLQPGAKISLRDKKSGNGGAAKDSPPPGTKDSQPAQDKSDQPVAEKPAEQKRAASSEIEAAKPASAKADDKPADTTGDDKSAGTKDAR